MDRLFKKYTDPFYLLNTVIQTGDLAEWVEYFVDSENDHQIYEIWLHKVFDKGFEEFKNSISKPAESVDLETTVNDSFNILNGFIPEDWGES